jgi:hypothetical protein
MMADLAGRPRTFRNSSNAFVAIGQKAREISDRTLVLGEFAGFAVAVAVLAWAPRTLEIIFLAIAVGALGLWGVIDHMHEARRRTSAPIKWMLSSFRFTIAAVGITAAILAGYALIGRLMGVFIL